MNGPLKHYTKWKKSDTKQYILLWFHLYEISGIGNYIESESRLVVSKGWGEGRMGSDWLMVMESSVGMKWWKCFETRQR